MYHQISLTHNAQQQKQSYSWLGIENRRYRIYPKQFTSCLIITSLIMIVMILFCQEEHSNLISKKTNKNQYCLKYASEQVYKQFIGQIVTSPIEFISKNYNAQAKYDQKQENYFLKDFDKLNRIQTFHKLFIDQFQYQHSQQNHSKYTSQYFWVLEIYLGQSLQEVQQCLLIYKQNDLHNGRDQTNWIINQNLDKNQIPIKILNYFPGRDPNSILYLKNMLSQIKILNKKWQLLINKQKLTEALFTQSLSTCNRIWFINDKTYKINFDSLQQTFKYNQSNPLHVFYPSSSKIDISNKSQIFEQLDNNYQNYILNQFVISFQVQLLSAIHPFNFQFYSLYGFQALIVIPILSLCLNEALISKNEDIIVDGSLIKWKYVYQITLEAEDSEHFCFLTFPRNLKNPNISELILYLNSFKKWQPKNMSSSLTIHLPFIQSLNYRPFYDLIKQQSKSQFFFKDVKIKMRSVLSIPTDNYELVHSHCPKKSTVISSRMNINFQREILKHCNLCENQKKNYVVFNDHKNQKGQYMISKYLITNQLNLRNNSLIVTELSLAHLYCSNILKTSFQYPFLNQNLQMYQGQTILTLFLFQKVRNLTNKSSQMLFEQISPKQQTLQQKQEMKYIYDRSQFDPFYINHQGFNYTPLSIPFNHLHNIAYMKQPKPKIPRIIHQIYLSSGKEMSPVRQMLKNTIIKANPSFEYRLWTIKDITPDNFPYTYKTLKKILNFTEMNHYSQVAGIARIEILYHYGGFYFDLKAQGIRSLEPLRKFQTIFYRFRDWKLNGSQCFSLSDLVCGPENGYIGVIKHSDHFKFILEKFFNDLQIEHQTSHPFSTNTGYFVLGQGFNEKQIITNIFFGSDLFHPSKDCNQNMHKNSSEIQQTFEIIFNNKKRHLGLPCRNHEWKYLQTYSILANTVHNQF